MNVTRLRLLCKTLLTVAIFLLLGPQIDGGVSAKTENLPPEPAAQRAETGLLRNIKAIAAGRHHTCALTANGGVKCWGRNDVGQLGDGSTTNRLTPVDVSGLTSGVQTVIAGDRYTCALTTAGGVKCWGSNEYGQLGDGTTTDRLTPVDVSGLTGDVQAVAAGLDHACALTAAGDLKCWGSNEYGQLGNGTMTDHLTPVQVSGLTRGVRAVAAGGYHTCAITAGGGLKCWGDNENGELGDGTATDHLTPVDVKDLSSDVQAVVTGEYHTCALTNTGGVKCWGWNEDGQLGDGTATDQRKPANVNGLTGGVQAIASGLYHACALTDGGGLKCWGSNEEGELGDGATTDRLTPVDVNGLTGGVQAVAAGGFHTCALTVGGSVKCWGANWHGQLGDGATTDHTTPVDVSGLMGGVLVVAAGRHHTCALTVGGSVKCWGYNGDGELGDGTTDPHSAPVDVGGLTGGAQAIAAGEYHTCALTTAGGVKCWGANWYGQLGDGTTTDRLTPVDVSGLTGGVQTITAGSGYTCALLSSGGVKCWGYNRSGQLGDGATTDHSTPVDVSGLTSGVQAIAAGSGFHTCALTTSGGVKCWGGNGYGQLGDGTTTTHSTPVDVIGLTGWVQAVTVGGYHSCVLTGGGAKCWGDNAYGELGDGTTADRPVPVDVNGLTGGVQAVVTSSNHTCALTTAAAVKCWGNNEYGQLGDGTTNGRSAPVDVSGFDSSGSSAQAITLGEQHTCALTTAAAAAAGSGVKCWGGNGYGQLGVNPGWIPVDVIDPNSTPIEFDLYLPLIRY